MVLFRRLYQEISNATLLLEASLSSIKAEVTNQVAYTSQFANPEWAEKVLKDGLPKTSDPDWQQSGASSVAEYEKWVTTVCGMACTVMVLKYFFAAQEQTIPLAKQALQKGVYQELPNEISNMHYREYVAWVKDKGVRAVLYSRLTLRGVKKILSDGGLVIVSVNPNIRGYETAPREQIGGHLVLVTGYSDTNQTITLQNPSGFASTATQVDHTLSFDAFKGFYAGRGIAVYRP